MYHYVVRPMQLRDISQVAEIEKESFPMPWSASYFKRELIFNRSARYFVACRNEDGESNFKLPVSKFKRSLCQAKLIFRWDGKPTSSGYIVGFIGLWIVAQEAHITTIAVKEDCRRQGIGESLLITAVESATEQNSHFVTLEVRTSNIAARKLYEKYNFIPREIRRGYYLDTQEDALIMTTDRPTSTSFQSNFQYLKRIHAKKWRPLKR